MKKEIIKKFDELIENIDNNFDDIEYESNENCKIVINAKVVKDERMIKSVQMIKRI